MLRRHRECVSSIKRQWAPKGVLQRCVEGCLLLTPRWLPQRSTAPLPPRRCAGAGLPGAWRGAHRPGLPFLPPVGPLVRHEGSVAGACRRRRARTPRWRHFGVPAGGGGGVVCFFAVCSFGSAVFRHRYECGGARTRDGVRRAAL